MNKIIKSQSFAICVFFLAGFFMVGCIHNNSTTATPVSTPSTVDTDKDGIPNVSDTDIDNDGILNTIDKDIDGDGIPNNTDSDANGDGIPDSLENNYTSGIGVVAVDTVGYSLSLNAVAKNVTTSATEIIDLNSVRKVITDNKIVLSTFSLTDLSIVASDANGFIQANSNKHIVVKVSYFDQSNNKILALESAASTSGVAGPVLTMGDLEKGIDLNKEIFGSDPGFQNFTDMVKDASKPAVTTVIEVTFIDEPSLGSGNLNLNFILKAAGKMAS
jgi:hypothetical protein